MDKPQPTKEQIELRAYELYLQRGAQPDQDLADWFAAEQELAEPELTGQQDSSEIAEPATAQKAKRGAAASASAN